MKHLLRKQFKNYVQESSIEDEQLLELLIEQNNRKGLIEYKIKHTINLASMIARKYARNDEDVVEMAMVRLVECVDNYLLTSRHKPFNAYYRKYMYNAIKRDVVEDKLLGSCERTKQRIAKRITLDSLNTSVETGGLVNEKNIFQESVISISVKTEPVRSDETYILIDSIRSILTEEEFLILEYVAQGYTDKEVSDIIKTSVTFVQNNRSRIQHKIRMELLR